MSNGDFSKTDDIVARADSFMLRQRPRPSSDLDDLPVLTDIVQLPAKPPIAPPPSPQMTLGQMEHLAQELAILIQKKLAAEIPTLVEAAMQSVLPQLSRNIQEGVTETTRDAIKDFIKQHHQNDGNL